MKKHLLFALLSLTGVSSLSSETITRATFDESTGKFTFYITGVPTNDEVYLEMSKFDDFSRVREMKLTMNNDRECKKTVSNSALEAADYYWRIRDNGQPGSRKSDFIYPHDRTPLTFTGKAAVYKEAVDSTEFETAVLDDGMELKLSSIWLRSGNYGNRPYMSIDRPGSNDYKTLETYNHGMAINDGVIYLSRGSMNTSGWDSDKTRVWLERYSLATGEELPMLWVYAPGNEEYPTADIMPWIRCDDDGTVCFTTTNLHGNYKKITLYTVDLNGVSADTHSTVATEVITVDVKDTRVPRFVNVTGSIKKGEYEIWGVCDNLETLSTTKPFECPVLRWKVSGGSATASVSTVNKVGFMEAGAPDIMDYVFKVYPAGDGLFYLHGYHVQNNTALSPTLYRFTDGGVSEMLGSYTNNPDLYPLTKMRISGISPFTVAGNAMLAYGVSTDADKGSVAQIVHTPSLSDDFSGHRLLWRPGEADGLSTNKIQGCDVQFIPDENASTGGILVMYLPNGALGVYRIDTSSPTVGIDTADEDLPECRYDGNVLKFSRPVDGATLYDAAGRVVARTDAITTAMNLPGLRGGVYMLAPGGRTRTVKIIVR